MIKLLELPGPSARTALKQRSKRTLYSKESEGRGVCRGIFCRRRLTPSADQRQLSELNYLERSFHESCPAAQFKPRPDLAKYLIREYRRRRLPARRPEFHRRRHRIQPRHQNRRTGLEEAPGHPRTGTCGVGARNLQGACCSVRLDPRSCPGTADGDEDPDQLADLPSITKKRAGVAPRCRRGIQFR